MSTINPLTYSGMPIRCIWDAYGLQMGCDADGMQMRCRCDAEFIQKGCRSDTKAMMVVKMDDSLYEITIIKFKNHEII